MRFLNFFQKIFEHTLQYIASWENDTHIHTYTHSIMSHVSVIELLEYGYWSSKLILYFFGIFAWQRNNDNTIQDRSCNLIWYFILFFFLMSLRRSFVFVILLLMSCCCKSFLDIWKSNKNSILNSCCSK